MALRTNLTGIITTAAKPSLQWFANRLVEKAFITWRDAQEILGRDGVAPARQASLLMDSVFTRIDVSDGKRHLFDAFVDIFSNDVTYEDLVGRLSKGEL